MKKIISLVALGAFLSIIFANSAKAQDGYVIHTNYFDKYAKEQPNTIQYRHDKLNREVLVMSPCNRDTIKISYTTYDPAGNRLAKTNLLIYKDKKKGLVCLTKLKEADFEKTFKDIKKSLDGKDLDD